MEIDKDILFKNNKIYSPEKCIFVPHTINVIFTNKKSKSNNLPIGVWYHPKNKKYIAGCSFGDGDTKHLGSFDTPEEAFMVYKKVKEKYIKEVAEKYKNKIPLILYKSLIKYEV